MSIFYKSWRVGEDGKLFQFYKFRTMIEGAVGPESTSEDDKRITRIGRILRKFKIDELPQFWNVLKGDMSLVGPRPEVPSVMAIMHKQFPDEYGIIISVKPGITDLASLWDFNEEERLAGEKDPHKAYLEKIWPEKRRLQIEYIKNKSFWLDIKIILLTIKKILFRK